MHALLPLLLACGPTGVVLSEPPAENGGDTGTILPDEPDDTDETETLPDNGTDTGDDPDEPDLTDDEIYEAFFDPAAIQEIAITLSDRAMAQLNRNGDTYVEGGVVINGKAYASVGVRLKGSSTYQDLNCSDGYCKAGFKIKLDEFVDGEDYGGLQRITLNNMTTDYTQSKEVIVYDLLHRHGALASRANYARVTLNGTYWGLYTNLESADDEWLKRRFADTTGNFWGTGDSYGDFYYDYIHGGGWVLKEGPGDTTRLEEVMAALDAYRGDFEAELGPYVNVDQFLAYWGWCVAVGNYDGYPFNINDMLVYEDPSDGGRLVFAPWGTDESWSEYEYTGQTWNVVGGRLGAACLADQACVTALKTKIDEAVTAYAATDVLGMAEAAWALSADAAEEDRKRPYGYEYVEQYRAYYAELIPRYPTYVRRSVGL